jgi:small subunit ribosomal protein S15
MATKADDKEKAAPKKATKAKKTTEKKVEVKVAVSLRDNKKGLMKKHGKHEKDTGSAEVQAAILTYRINSLTGHLKTHPKDKHSRLGLLKLVGKRRKHLQYLKGKNKEEYEDVVKKLKLRK